MSPSSFLPSTYHHAKAARVHWKKNAITWTSTKKITEIEATGSFSLSKAAIRTLLFRIYRVCRLRQNNRFTILVAFCKSIIQMIIMWAQTLRQIGPKQMSSIQEWWVWNWTIVNSRLLWTTFRLTRRKQWETIRPKRHEEKIFLSETRVFCIKMRHWIYII